MRRTFIVTVLLVAGLLSAAVGHRVPLVGAQDAAPPVQGSTPMLTLTADVTVYSWPDDNASTVGNLPAQSTVVTDGRLEDSSWWEIPFPNAPDGNGWIQGKSVTPNEAAPYVPTYVIVMPTPEPLPTPMPTPGACTYNAAFVADVAIPDGTVVSPAQPINKIWRLRNTGTCDWDAATVLNFIGGSQMGAASTATFAPTAPGATVDIGVTFYAPSEAGVYRSVWQLQSPQGRLFGTPVTVVVNVPGPAAPPTPVPSTPPTPVPQPSSINFWSDSNSLNAGQCTNLHWDVNNVQAVYLEYGGKMRGVSGQDSRSVCPSKDGSNYVLHVMLYDGSQQTRSVQINVSVPGVKIDFWSDRSKITIGECTVLDWKVSNSSRVRLNQGNGWNDVSAVSNLQVCPAYPTTYHLKVTDLSGSNHERTVTIKTQAPPPGLLTPVPSKKKK